MGGCGSCGNGFGASLVDDLIETADSLRSLYTDFGLRNRRIFLVWIGWVVDTANSTIPINAPLVHEGAPPEGLLEAISALDLNPDVVGIGRPVLLYEYELKPRPLVGSMSGVAKDQDAVGLTERGGLTVTQISMRFSEDFLMGLIPPFRDETKPDSLKPGIDFYWEVDDDRRQGFVTPGYAGSPDQRLGNEKAPPRRRFHVSSTPERVADKFLWSVGLRRADGERARDGSLSVVG